MAELILDFNKRKPAKLMPYKRNISWQYNEEQDVYTKGFLNRVYYKHISYVYQCWQWQDDVTLQWN